MKCKHWDKVPHNFASEPLCAFDEKGKFLKNNWNCQLMNRLRDYAEYDPIWNDDNNLGVLAIDNGDYVILGWYKSRGRTDLFVIYNGSEFREGTEDDAEKIFQYLCYQSM
jgi:hypothetical protein